jgi:hypothetical protein
MLHAQKDLLFMHVAPAMDSDLNPKTGMFSWSQMSLASYFLAVDSKRVTMRLAQSEGARAIKLAGRPSEVEQLRTGSCGQVRAESRPPGGLFILHRCG